MIDFMKMGWLLQINAIIAITVCALSVDLHCNALSVRTQYAYIYLSASDPKNHRVEWYYFDLIAFIQKLMHNKCHRNYEKQNKVFEGANVRYNWTNW